MIIATFKQNKKITKTVMVLVNKLWLRGIDSNYRPSGYEALHFFLYFSQLAFLSF